MARIERRPGHKILIELPDWALERHIYILAGTELLAKIQGDKIFIKKDRCNRCGICCMTLSHDGQYAKYGFIDDRGWCKFLRQNGEGYECELGLLKPFNCIISEAVHKKCKITYEE